MVIHTLYIIHDKTLRWTSKRRSKFYRKWRLDFIDEVDLVMYFQLFSLASKTQFCKYPKNFKLYVLLKCKQTYPSPGLISSFQKYVNLSISTNRPLNLRCSFFKFFHTLHTFFLIHKSSMFSGGHWFSGLKTACCFAEDQEWRLFW